MPLALFFAPLLRRAGLPSFPHRSVDRNPLLGAFVDQVRGLLGNVEAVATKGAVGESAISGLSPEAAQRQIRDGVTKGVVERARMKPTR